MTVPQPSESARLAQLEQRVQVLEDVNAIRHLKARYAASCDDQYNPDGLAALFTEDAVWESQGRGWFEGREAIRAFLGVENYSYSCVTHMRHEDSM
jgi:nuclear transport factor 2 (NTF2) superfamily protein